MKFREGTLVGFMWVRKERRSAIVNIFVFVLSFLLDTTGDGMGQETIGLDRDHHTSFRLLQEERERETQK